MSVTALSEVSVTAELEVSESEGALDNMETTEAITLRTTEDDIDAYSTDAATDDAERTEGTTVGMTTESITVDGTIALTVAPTISEEWIALATFLTGLLLPDDATDSEVELTFASFLQLILLNGTF